MRHAWLLLLAGMAGCSSSKIPVTVGSAWADSVTIDEARIDFVRVYHEQITPEVLLTLSAKTEPWLDNAEIGNTYEYELKQDNGAWVDFDCDNVAEKIIDHSLVPVVERQCEALHDIAAQYWKDNPNPAQFVDGQGTTWTRVPVPGGTK